MPKRSAIDVDNNQREWSNYTIPELKVEVGLRGLPEAGKKADLIARLEAQVATQSVQPLGTPSAPGVIDLATRAPKSKKVKVGGPEPIIEGPLASDVVKNQMMNYETGEMRLREFVPAPDDKFKDKVKRIQRDRMFMLDRNMSYDREGHPCETFTIAGSTGNIYTCSIGRKPRCDCMDARMRGQKCKHINYALIVILKTPVYMQYQLAFLSDELREIFANAPVTRAPDLGLNDGDSDHPTEEVIRKPVEAECPICVFAMEPGENIVWCRAACGQNFHQECFEQWRKSKMGGRVTCVYCRSEWLDDGVIPSKMNQLERLKETAPKIGSYKNIGYLSIYQGQVE